MTTRLRLLVVTIAIALSVTGAISQGAQPDETARLSALARVWGLLKYFHPDVATGTMDWDAALLASISRVRASGDKASFNEELMRLIRSAGSSPRTVAGAPLEQPDSDPAFAWLDDGDVFERSTIAALKTVRFSERSTTNRFVKPTTGTSGNPDFNGDAIDAAAALPPLETRLLALFRLWNMVQYYAPNRDITDRAWSDVLPSMVPEFVSATTPAAYQLAVCELAALITDTHAATNSLFLSSYWGSYTAPFEVRYIESETVVTRVFGRYVRNGDVRVGDIVTSFNGTSTADLRSRLRKYMTASNEGSLQRNLNLYVMRSQDPTIRLGLLRDGGAHQVTLSGVTLAAFSSEASSLDAALPKSRMLSGNIGYVNMGRLVDTDVAGMMDEFRNTRAIIFDVRNYPKGTMYLIAERLNPERRPFAKFTTPRYDQPGTLSWTEPYFAGPNAPTNNYYRGRVILLGDDRTQSHAEFTMMALRTAPDVVVVGTPTAGADGNVSRIVLPGGLSTYFSGLGVFYPDNTPTQRVGIIPDVLVEPTIRGTRSGVDEVLERALTLVQ